MNDRGLIFISHATPEDNDFVVWLGARLASAGYSVWSDVTKLIGGEVFWEDIEAAIRKDSIKVLSVLSKAAINKNGFKDELFLALLVERSEQIKDFVIPVRLDGIAFDKFPVEILRRNAVDAFSSGWHGALGRILEKLEHDKVPRNNNVTTDALSAWSTSMLEITAGLIREKENLLSNWLPIKDIPTSIRIHSCLPGYQPLRPELYAYPAEIYKGKVISFAGANDLISQGLEQECEISLEYFRKGGLQGLFEIPPKDASNRLTSLLQRAWYYLARSRGLKDFSFANNKLGFYLPLPEKGIERIKFFSPTGKKGSRALIGKSEKRRVYWHYTPEMRPNLGRKPRFSLFPHVIFTSDGLSPVGDSKRMHTLRRSFCRSWWQDRWRDMSLAYLALLTGDSGDLIMPLAPDQFLVADSSFETYESPVSVDMGSGPDQDDSSQDDSCDDENVSREDIEEFRELFADEGELK